MWLWKTRQCWFIQPAIFLRCSSSCWWLSVAGLWFLLVTSWLWFLTWRILGLCSINTNKANNVKLKLKSSLATQSFSWTTPLNSRRSLFQMCEKNTNGLSSTYSVSTWAFTHLSIFFAKFFTRCLTYQMSKRLIYSDYGKFIRLKATVLTMRPTFLVATMRQSWTTQTYWHSSWTALFYVQSAHSQKYSNLRAIKASLSEKMAVWDS